jgi:hypothetical protein
MNNPKALKVVITLLAVALLTSLGFLAHSLSQIWWWKQEVWGLDGQVAVSRALDDFGAGKLRLFVISGERSNDKFSGTNDGPFQIWFPQYYTKPYSLRYSMEQQVWFYDEKMRYMQQHPERFSTITNRRPNTALEPN